MSSVIILGDLHIGKGTSIGINSLGFGLNSRIKDQFDLLDWVLDQAIEHCSSHIIITGDVFEDPKTPYYLIKMFISWLKKCHDHNINILIVRGNHDVLRFGNTYSSPLDIITEADIQGVRVFSEIDTIFIDTTAITLVPFRDRKSFQVDSNAEALNLLKNSFTYELALIPETYNKVMIGHLAIEGSIPVGDEIDDLTNELFCTIDMLSGYDYVWMGHVHQPQVLNKNPYISHIGSMDISNFGETNHKKKIAMLECSKQEFSYVEIPTRKLKKITIDIEPDVQDATQFIIDKIKSEKLDNSIVRLEVTLPPEVANINKKAIHTALKESNVFNIAGINETKTINPIKKQDDKKNIDIKMDVLSAIKSYAETNIEKENIDLFTSTAKEIYSSYLSEKK